MAHLRLLISWHKVTIDKMHGYKPDYMKQTTIYVFTSFSAQDCVRYMYTGRYLIE